MISWKFWLKNPGKIIYRVKYGIYELFHKEEPWLTPSAVSFLKNNILIKQTGFEWGSGRSTVWLAKRMKKLISVEHDLKWYNNISKKIKEQNVANIEYWHIPLDHAESEPTHPLYEKTPKYVLAIDKISEGSLDIVIVDGHYRQACILAAIPKIKNNGLLLIDDSNWLTWEGWGVPADWQIVSETGNGIKTTTIWQKITARK